MATFYYKAANAMGKIQRGSLEASHGEDLQARLARMELLLISYQIGEEVQGGLHWRGLWQRQVARRSLMLFCLHMNKLLQAGIPIPEALAEVRLCGLDARMQEVVSSLIGDLTHGKTLSEAMRAYAGYFPAAFHSLIRVGERSGKLTEIFQGLADNIKWEDELYVQTKKALRYPLFVGVVVTGLFFFLMLYLTPQLVRFIPSMGGELPVHTLLLIGLSNFVIQWWPWMLATPLVIWVGSILLAQVHEPFCLLRDRFKLGFPHFGPLMRRIYLVRFAVHFALMYRSGVPVLESMEILAPLSGNRAFERLVIESGQRIAEEGMSVSEAFGATALFPHPLPRLLLVGEKSGQLDQAMLDVSYFLDREVQESIAALQTLIEPVLTLFLGTMLGWVIFSVLGPIYETISHVKF